MIVCDCCGEPMSEEDIFEEDKEGYVYCEGCCEQYWLDFHYGWDGPDPDPEL